MSAPPEDPILAELQKISAQLTILVELTERAYKMLDTPAGRFLAKRAGGKNGGVQLGGKTPVRG